MSLIKLKKQEMETQVGPWLPGSCLPGPTSGRAPGTGWQCRLRCGAQVRVLELEKTLEAERMRLGELRKQHYVLAGVMGTPGEEEASRPSAAPRSGATKKPPLAQKPTVAPRQDHQVPRGGLERVAAPGWVICCGLVH